MKTNPSQPSTMKHVLGALGLLLVVSTGCNKSEPSSGGGVAPANPPVATMVIVSGLLHPDMRVEIEVEAVLREVEDA